MPVSETDELSEAAVLTARLRSALRDLATTEAHGRVTEVLGTLLKAVGVRARVGELCELRARGQRPSLAEVVGFRGPTTILTPLEDITGICNDTEVVALRRAFTVPTGPKLIGRVLDGLGNPVDGAGPLTDAPRSNVDASPPAPLLRRPVSQVFVTGVRAIDGLLTVGQGQRMGVIAPVGVGKTTLIAMLARQSRADVNVIALVGERGREVGEFVSRTLGPRGLARSVVVVSTADRPAVERAKCALVATAIAEAFRREGRQVLLLMDSVTRYARALREIGLASGEAPTRRGYPPSVFAALPRLLERAGNDAHGSITAFYTLLLEGEEDSDPMVEEIRSLLDGHLHLSRAQAQAQQFPAIDILSSLSRSMAGLVSTEHQGCAAKILGWFAKYREMELLLQMGEYKPGADLRVDEAVARAPDILRFLAQRADEVSSMDETRAGLLGLVEKRGT
jgi:ATP synthase in type III secretion protein N